MQNRGFFIFIAVLFSVFFIYSLSFTFVASNIEKKADDVSKDENGLIDRQVRQKYIDSLWNTEVYDLGFAQFTYGDVKDKALNLGLDLQGGMHLTVEVSPVDILIALANRSQDENFLTSIEDAKKAQLNSQASFVDLFYSAYRQKAGNNKLNTLFATAANKDRIAINATDEEVMAYLKEEIESAVSRAFEVIRTRIDKFGVTQPNVQLIPNTSRIQIELPGVSNPERVRKLVQDVAKLEFWEVYKVEEYTPFLQQINEYWVANKMKDERKKVKTDSKKSDGDELFDDTTPSDTASTATDEDEALFADDATSSDDTLATDTTDTAADSLALEQDDQLVSPILGRRLQIREMRSADDLTLVYEASDTVKINEMLADEGVRNILGNGVRFLWGVKPVIESEGKSFYELYAIKVPPTGVAPLDGEVVSDARQDIDMRGRVEVSMAMNAEGARKWERLTTDNVNRQIAIALDSYIYSAPNVNEPISGGRSSITGSFEIEEAQDLANVLKAGKLPAPTRIVEEAVIGPSLGAAAQKQGITSIVVGLAIVVLFMIVYYARGGFVANSALLFNIFFIFGALAQLKAALTLPGIAGIVLTIGMSIDANVLIFDSIRDEMRSGRGLLDSIKKGYDRAFVAIVDANITTFLTAMMLYIFGAGPIKGFAITLMIGIICSFFTAVYITRIIISYIVAKAGDKSKLNFGFPFTIDILAAPTFDFLSKRKIAYVISGSLIVAGLISLFTVGLNYGVDFKGGRSYVFEYKEAVSPSEIEVILSNKLQAGVEAKSYDTQNKVKITTTYKVEDESDEADAEVIAVVKKALEEYRADAEPELLSTAKVGATIADDIRNSAKNAVILSLLVLFSYIWLRFSDWRFGLGAVAALFHDTLIVLSIFSIAYALGFSLDVDQVFVAAVLTIIGYSLNDTVVVFDRIREVLKDSVGESYEKTLNAAINSTLSRTVVTSLTTLLVVLILLFFGGEVLRGFAFALTVGILVGTYSSIFVSTSVVLDTSSKKYVGELEEKAKARKAAAAAKDAAANA
ncbi:MAG: protein translocase subunit SecDF [Bernardetiaceae bacterium]|nr:protein translocase subunit SecDF [Bernardetiaceae bacterium]